MLKGAIEYFLQRFTLFPWFFLPLYFIFLIFQEFKDPALYFVLLIFFLFFRILDDYFCRYVDRVRKTDFLPMLEKIRIVIIYLGVLTFTCFYFKLGLSSALMLFGFVAVSFLLYLVSEKTILVEFISLLKYPFITYIIEMEVLRDISYAPLLIFFSMLIPEILEKNKKLSSCKAQVLQCFLLLVVAGARYAKGL